MRSNVDFNVVDAVIGAVAEACGLKHRDLQGRSKARACVDARFMAMAILRDQLDLPYKAIGRVFRKDHGSVMHGCRKVCEWLESDRAFRRQWEQVVPAALKARVDAERRAA